MKDVLDVVALFHGGLRALDVQPKAVVLDRESGMRFAALVQDCPNTYSFTVPRRQSHDGSEWAQLDVMGIQFRWPV